jgi:hypothetical protein
VCPPERKVLSAFGNPVGALSNPINVPWAPLADQLGACDTSAFQGYYSGLPLHSPISLQSNRSEALTVRFGRGTVQHAPRAQGMAVTSGLS